MPSTLDQSEKGNDPFPALRDQLSREFGDIVAEERIDEAADRAIKSFGEVRVHAFLSILAFRRARRFLIDSLRAGETAASWTQPPTHAAGA